MTNEQIEAFSKKRLELKKIRADCEQILSDASLEETKNNLSCDHRHSDGKLAGMEFQGSYCGFKCQICGCGVSYEKMGY